MRGGQVEFMNYKIVKTYSVNSLGHRSYLPYTVDENARKYFWFYTDGYKLVFKNAKKRELPEFLE